MSERDLGLIERLRNAVVVIGTGMILTSILTGVGFYYKSGMRLNFLESEMLKKADSELVNSKLESINDKIKMYHHE